MKGNINQLKEYEQAIASQDLGDIQIGPSQEVTVTPQPDLQTLQHYPQLTSTLTPSQLTQNLNTLTSKYAGGAITLNTFQETLGPNRQTRQRNQEHLQAQKPTFLYTENVNKKYNQPTAEEAKIHPIGFIQPGSQTLLNEKKLRKRTVHHISDTRAKERVFQKSLGKKYELHDQFTKSGNLRSGAKQEAFDRVVDINYNEVGRRAIEAAFRKEDSLKKTGNRVRTDAYKKGDFGF